MKIGILPLQPEALALGERMSDHVRKRYGQARVMDIQQEAAARVGACNVILVPIASNWSAWLAANGGVHTAIARALAQEKLIIPVLLAGASMPTEAELPQDIRSFHRRQAYALRGDPHFTQDSAALFQQLDAKLRWRPTNVPILAGALIALLSYGILAGGLFFNHATIARVASLPTPLLYFAAAIVLIASYAFTLGFVLYRAVQRQRWLWLVAAIAVFLIYFTQSGNAFGYHVFPFTCIFYGLFGTFGPRREIS